MWKSDCFFLCTSCSFIFSRLHLPLYHSHTQIHRVLHFFAISPHPYKSEWLSIISELCHLLTTFSRLFLNMLTSTDPSTSSWKTSLVTSLHCKNWLFPPNPCFLFFNWIFFFLTMILPHTPCLFKAFCKGFLKGIDIKGKRMLAKVCIFL